MDHCKMGQRLAFLIELGNCMNLKSWNLLESLVEMLRKIGTYFFYHIIELLFVKFFLEWRFCINYLPYECKEVE